MNIAWKQRGLGYAWRTARSFDHVAKGATRKWSGLPTLSRPTASQWADHYSKDPTEGGWDAQE
eukprot:5783061-Alexandrium_andersonii.AAC.1